MYIHFKRETQQSNFTRRINSIANNKVLNKENEKKLAYSNFNKSHFYNPEKKRAPNTTLIELQMTLSVSSGNDHTKTIKLTTFRIIDLKLLFI